MIIKNVSFMGNDAESNEGENNGHWEAYNKSIKVYSYVLYILIVSIKYINRKSVVFLFCKWNK